MIFGDKSLRQRTSSFFTFHLEVKKFYTKSAEIAMATVPGSEMSLKDDPDFSKLL